MTPRTADAGWAWRLRIAYIWCSAEAASVAEARDRTLGSAEDVESAGLSEVLHSERAGIGELQRSPAHSRLLLIRDEVSERIDEHRQPLRRAGR